MASVNMFSSAIQSIPKQALEWEMGNFNAQDLDIRQEGAFTKERLGVNFKNAGIDLVNNERARGSLRSGWAGVRSDRLRNTYDYNTGSVDRLMKRQLDQLTRNKHLATLGYTL